MTYEPEAPRPEPASPAPVTEDPVVAFNRALAKLTPRVWVTPLLIALNVAVFIAMVATGAHPMSPTIDSLLKWGANFGPKTTSGQWWRLGASMFIHIGVFHIAMNMVVLWSIGRFVERLVGGAGFIALYAVAGLCGSLASVGVHPFMVSAGASGAVFGLYGGLLGFLLRQRGAVPKPLLKKLSGSAVAFVVYNVAFGLVPGIDMAAHIGGLAGGFGCGLLLGLPLDAADLPARRWLRAGLVLALGAALTVGIGFALPHTVDLDKELGAFYASEARVLEAYNGAVRKSQANQLDDAGYAKILDGQVLPEWRSARTKLTEIKRKGLPERQRWLIDKLVAYADARLRGWELFSDALKHNDADKARAAQLPQADAEKILQEIKAKLQK